MACIPTVLLKQSRRINRLSSPFRCLQPYCVQQNFTCARMSSTYNCAWQIYEYGGRDKLTFTKTKKMPVISSPRDVLVEVNAASVNPMDVRMRDGYGSTLINVFRTIKTSFSSTSEFPLVLGRDFSGVVVAKGHEVTEFKVGDEVWGAISGHRQGTHAMYTLAGADEISHKPKSLDHVESASIPYVAMTTYSAFCKFAQVKEEMMSGKSVLVVGGGGGIGTFTIQWLKTLGSHVTTVCSTDSVDLVTSLGADDVIDYKTTDVSDEVQKRGGFDFVYDAIGGEDVSRYCATAVKPGGYVISLVSPLLQNTDNFGLGLGLAKSSTDLACSVTQTLQKQAFYRWAFFTPDGKALQKIADLVDSGEIRPIVEEVFPMDRLPEAYEKVGHRKGRGKTVIDMKLMTELSSEQEQVSEATG